MAYNPDITTEERYEAGIKARITANKRKTFLKNNPDIDKFYDDISYHDHEISFDQFHYAMKEAIEQWGSLTDKQASALRNSLERKKEFEAKKAELNAEREKKLKNVTIPQDRFELTGKVLSFKTYDSDWGRTYKMLVERADGYKFFGTIPSDIDIDVKIGDEVSFMAKADQKEIGFAIYSRPTKARIIQKEEV